MIRCLGFIAIFVILSAQTTAQELSPREQFLLYSQSSNASGTGARDPFLKDSDDSSAYEGVQRETFRPELYTEDEFQIALQNVDLPVPANFSNKVRWGSKSLGLIVVANAPVQNLELIHLGENENGHVFDIK